MIKVCALVALAALCCCVRGAVASERSEVLWSLGLIEFHAERYPKALEYFEQAVQADAGDPYARYYRGVTYGRLERFDAAIDDLRTIPTYNDASPELLERTAVELGAALLHARREGEAIAVLDPLRASNLGPEVSLLIGIAQLRAGHVDEARRSLRQAAAAADTMRLAAEYYLGEADYRDCKWSEARAHFAYVTANGDSTELAQHATDLLAKLDNAVHPPYSLSASVGFTYDSNVVLAPEDKVLKEVAGISNEDDGRVELSAGASLVVPATYLPWQSDRVALRLGYEFFQSLHFRLNNFNTQDHKPSIELDVDAGPVRLGLLGRYDYVRRDDDGFLHQASFSPSLIIPEDPVGRTEVFYWMRSHDFIGQPLSAKRDGFNHEVGMRQVFNLDTPQRYVFAGYRYDREDPANDAGQPFAYDGHELDAGMGWAFGQGSCARTGCTATAELSYDHRWESYDRRSRGRRDEEHRLDALLRKPLTDVVALKLEYRLDLNDSNDPRFEYNRNIVMVGFEVGL